MDWEKGELALRLGLRGWAGKEESYGGKGGGSDSYGPY